MDRQDAFDLQGTAGTTAETLQSEREMRKQAGAAAGYGDHSQQLSTCLSGSKKRPFRGLIGAPIET
jgi:hypothetical protein